MCSIRYRIFLTRQMEISISYVHTYEKHKLNYSKVASGGGCWEFMSMHVDNDDEEPHFSSLPLRVIIKDTKANAFDAALLLRDLMDLRIHSTSGRSLTICMNIESLELSSSQQRNFLRRTPPNCSAFQFQSRPIFVFRITFNKANIFRSFSGSRAESILLSQCT